MKKTKYFIVTLGIVALLAFLVYSIVLISKPKAIEVQGEVEATQVKVASKLIGRVENLKVRRGTNVQKGDTLFMIYSPEVEAKMMQAQGARSAAEAQKNKAYNGAQKEDIEAAHNVYIKAQAAADLYEKTWHRVANLYAEGVVSAQKRDEAETQYKAGIETANAAKAVWQKAVKGARIEDKAAATGMFMNTEGIVSEVQAYLNERFVIAPASGEVANVLAEEGELVSAGFPVLLVVDLTDVWVTFNLREDLLASIKMGSEIMARFPALGNREVKLKVTYINVLGEFATWNATKTSGDFDMKTFEVRAVPVEKIEGFRPGMSAIVNWNNVAKN